MKAFWIRLGLVADATTDDEALAAAEIGGTGSVDAINRSSQSYYTFISFLVQECTPLAITGGTGRANRS